MKNDKVYAVITEVLRETRKAVLVEADGQVWLPKSVCVLHKVGGVQVIEMPAWLWQKNSLSFSMTTDLANRLNTTDNQLGGA